MVALLLTVITIRYGPENVPVSGEIHEAGSLILKYENNTRSKFDRHRT